MAQQNDTEFRRLVAALKEDVPESRGEPPHPSRAFRAPIPPHVYIAEALEMLHGDVEALRNEVRDALGRRQATE
jgi:hypothetical protein